MIRPLRRAHRRIIIMVAILLPLLLATTLLTRPAPPVQLAWPFEVP